MGKKRPSTDERQLPTASNLCLSGIDKPEEVLKACLPALRKQLGNSLGFTSADRTARVKRYAFTSANQQYGTARERYPILQLCQSVKEIYWAGITVDFQFLNLSYQLVDAGIIIFQGDGFGEKAPVLRAEWHCSDEHLQAVHAQPHWHVYPTPSGQIGPGFSPNSPRDFASDDQVKDVVDSKAQWKNFHFAMSAAWQCGDQKAHISAITSATALESWLCGCLSYIVGQLS
jgi:hypothetical protein